jgi:hypothetical protein
MLVEGQMRRPPRRNPAGDTPTPFAVTQAAFSLSTPDVRATDANLIGHQRTPVTPGGALSFTHQNTEFKQ